MSDTTFVRTRITDHVAWLTLNEPARLNPINLERIAEVNARVGEVSARDDVHVIVVTGAGKGFCSGADLSDAELRDTKMFAPGSGAISDTSNGVWTLRAARQPVIAMINGAAVGYGFELALQADLRVAGQSARFGLPYSRMGTVTDTGAATWLLPRLVGYAAAADLLFTGRLVPASEAAALGLLNRVVPDDELVATTTAIAADIASGEPESIRATKRMLVHAQETRAAEHLLLQFELFNRHRADLDAFVSARTASPSDKSTPA